MRERMYEILSTITKRMDDYGDGVSLRFKDGVNTLGVVRYGKKGSNYIMTGVEVYNLMEFLNEQLNFKEEDLSQVDKIIKDYCLEVISPKQ